ncbi:MAG: short-chain fatty acids transporter [Elusimicrobia bacterium]|nr:MAG: short-chain fatty acids transporter [Elusimicrobiota bacterium]
MTAALGRAALSLTRLSERWVPSAFVIAVWLSFAVMAAALALTPIGPAAAVKAWGDGLWALASFAMHMCLVLMTGAVIADAPVVRRGLDALAGVPKTDRGAVAFSAFVAMVSCWFHWGLGAVAAAFLARRIALKRPGVDYRLLTATAYFGMGAVWHAGLSGSAPLLMATPKNFLEAQVGGVIPTSETVFAPMNLALTAAVIAALTALAWLVYPARPEDAYLLSDEARARLDEAPPEPLGAQTGGAWMAFWEGGRAVPLSLGALGAAYVLVDWRAGTFSLTLEKLNLVFLALAVALHRSPADFGRSAEKAAGLVHGIVLQFPLYAGMFGVIKASGLDKLLGEAFVQAASAKTFPLVVYWYSAVLNYFIPSGGSKWAIEAPYLLEAAKALGVPAAKVVLAYSWGDMVTDAIQPFWCIPLLAVARLEFKEILGYMTLVFVVSGVLASAAFLLF